MNNAEIEKELKTLNDKFDSIEQDECKSFNDDYTKNEEGTRRRNVAKCLCLNSAMIDDIAIKYNVPNLHDLLIEAFPWTPYFEIDTDNDIPIDREDRATNAYTFIAMIRGYCLMAWNRVKMKDLFDEMGYSYDEDTEQ